MAETPKTGGLSHEKVETNNFLMIVLILLTVAVGGIVEIVPLFFQKSTTQPVEGLKPYTSLQLAGRRNGQPFTATVVPQAVQLDGRTVGRIMAQVEMSSEMAVVSAGPVEALKKALDRTWETCSMTMKMLGKMITGEASLKNIAKSIDILQIIHDHRGSDLLQSPPC